MPTPLRYPFLTMAMAMLLHTPARADHDVTSWLEANTGSLNHWQYNEFFLNTGAGGSHYNGSASLVAPFIEAWHDSWYGPLTNCSLLQTLPHMPTCRLKLQADMIACFQGNGWQAEARATGVRLTMGSATATVATANNLPQRFTVNTSVTGTSTEGTSLTLGVRVQNTNANWVAIDNMQLTFVGTDADLRTAERLKVRADLLDYFSVEEAEQRISDVEQQTGSDIDTFFTLMEQLRLSVKSQPKPGPLERLLPALTIGGTRPAYDEQNQRYLCPAPQQFFDTDYTALITYGGEATFTINGQQVASGDTYVFDQMQGGKTYTLTATTPVASAPGQTTTPAASAPGQTTTPVASASGPATPPVASAPSPATTPVASPPGRATTPVASAAGTLSTQLTFTALPVVQLYGDFGYTYNQGTVRINEPDGTFTDLMQHKTKWRGGSTNGADRHKRNYHLKLLNADGTKREEKLLGLRNDNSWIIEAAQVDMSRVRNRVMTDLWNHYSTPPYYIDQEPKARTGSRGKFVELLLNDGYQGIYCLYEPMDRKQMKLMKYDDSNHIQHGQLWKGKDWSYSVFMGHKPDNSSYPRTAPPTADGNSSLWDGYEMKYPDPDDVQPMDWQVLWQLVNFVCTSSDQNFRSQIASYVDLPLLIDYYILMEISLSTDNHGKNLFFATYDRQQDRRVTFGVWDMDAVMGQRWSDYYYHDDQMMSPTADYATYITRYEHGDYNLFRRLRITDAEDFNMRTRLRYRDLRQGPLATDSIIQRYRNYLQLFQQCGAEQREAERWSGDSDLAGHSIDFTDEMQYLESWITRRMNYLDQTRFDVGSLPSAGIADVRTNASNVAPIYDLQGRPVRTTRHGVYIQGGRKVLR